MKKISACLVLSVSMCLVGCIHQSTQQSVSTVMTPFQRGALIMDSVATEVGTAQKGLISLHSTGVVNDATYAAIQKVFLQTGLYGKQIDGLLAGQAKSKTITYKINKAITGIASISVIGLDPAIAKQVQAYAQIITDLLQQILPFFTNTAEIHYMEVLPWTRSSSLS